LSLLLVNRCHFSPFTDLISVSISL